MDPTSARLLDDLKDLLREKVITVAEWRTETAAIHARALVGQAPPAAPPAAPPTPPAAPAAQPAPPIAPAAGSGKNAKKRAAKKAKAATAPAAKAEPQAPPADPNKLTDKDVEDVLAANGFGEAEPATTEPAGFYHAEFTVQVFENKEVGGLRSAGSYTLRGWAQLTAELATATKAI